MFLQHLADGILSGAVVSLGAIGLSLTMKILRFANFSHSELLTWGAYSALIFLSFATSFGGMFDQNIGPLSFGVSLLISMVFASESTSFSVSPGRILVPPPAAPPRSELMTTQPLASVSASCQWKTTSAGRSSKARSCSFI